MMESPFTITIAQPPSIAPAESPPESKPGLLSPTEMSRSLAAFIQSNGLAPIGGFDHMQDQTDLSQTHPHLHAALQHLSNMAGLASPPPQMHNVITPAPQAPAMQDMPPMPHSIGSLPVNIPSSMSTSLSGLVDSSCITTSLQNALQQNLLSTQTVQAPIMHPQPATGVVQQIPCADIVTVQPRVFLRKPPASGGRGSVGLAVHVDGYLYHGKKTRLDGTKLLYCLDRTKYNCMAVAELFPNGTFRAKRPHTGHPPNPEECEVRLAKRMMRERAREHPEYTSKEIIREMVNDPTISEEAKKRLENYESLRKFVYRGRQQTRRPRNSTDENQQPNCIGSPIKMEESSAFTLPTSLAALFSQNILAAQNMAAQNNHISAFTTPKQEILHPTAVVGQTPFTWAQDDIARMMRDLQQQQTRSIEEIKFSAPVEPSTSNGSSATASTASAHMPSSGVWHTVDCDVIDFSRMPDGEFAYIFHAKDSVSRFSFACPMVSASQSDLLEAMKQLFFAYGPAHVVRVDPSYQNIEQELSPHFPLTAVEYMVPRKTPQGTAVARREAAMMKERIFAFLMETGRKDWAKILPQIKYTHNTEWIDEIECTPLEKFFSRNLPTGMSSRYSEENNESHDGMSDDGEVHHVESYCLSNDVKDEPMSERM